MENIFTNDLAEFAQSLVRLAVPVLARGYGELIAACKNNTALNALVKEQGLTAAVSSDALAQFKKNNGELVTAGEKEAEDVMRRAVEERYPAHAIVGEELGVKEGNTINWVFDPIDGTSAMIRTAIADAFQVPLATPRPAFGITIGVVNNGEAILGIVAELQSRAGTLELVATWIGQMGSVPTCNGNAIALPKAKALKEATLVCTVPEVMFGTAEKWNGYQALADAVKVSVGDQNCIGFMQLLNGSADIAYESDVAYHDVAPLVPILKAAGITVTDAQGKPLKFPLSAVSQEYTILAAAPALHAQALALIAKGVPQEKSRFQGKKTASSGYANKFPT